MTCDKATFLLEQRWDSALSGEEERALDQHLTGCEVCRAEAEAIELADRAFLELEDLAPAMDIATAVAVRIREEVPAERGRGWFWGGIAALAAMVASVLHWGVTLPASWFDPSHSIVLAALATAFTAVGHKAAEWASPVTMTVRGLSPMAGYVVPVIVLCGVLELGALMLWAIRRDGAAGVSSRA